MGATVTGRQNKCKTGREHCENCMVTPVEEMHSIHYTVCRKPWSCIAKRSNDPDNHNHRKNSIPVDIVHYDQCMQMLKIWHNVRTDLETKLYALTGDDSVENGRT